MSINSWDSESFSNLSLYNEDFYYNLNCLQNIRFLKLMHNMGVDLTIKHDGLPVHLYNEYGSYDDNATTFSIFSFSIKTIISKKLGREILAPYFIDLTDEGSLIDLHENTNNFIKKKGDEWQVDQVLIFEELFTEFVGLKTFEESDFSAYQVGKELIIFSAFQEDYYELMELIMKILNISLKEYLK